MVRFNDGRLGGAVLLLCALAGCGSDARDDGLKDALNAKEALLRRIRAEPNVFVGADPNRLAKLPLVPGENGQFSWGAFTIDTRKKYYSADVETHYDMSFYGGTFTVDRDGQWVAGEPNRAQAHKDPGGWPESRRAGR